jgi:ubiquinone/menaquinone biosynthesis C-methylase UbiE
MRRPRAHTSRYRTDGYVECRSCGLSMTGEPAEARGKRLRQRALFDGAAQLYDASRRGYPPELVEFMVATAGLHPGSAVLEVGCGTGQLTEQLVAYSFDLTAVDIGASMTSLARRRAGSATVRFQVAAFEELCAPAASFDLIVSATAFHWVDPDVRFEKAARLLRTGGWLALLSTGEKYDDPFGAALLDMWVARSDDGGAWVKQRKPSSTDIMTGTGLFDQPIEQTYSQRMSLAAETVIGVENTRATFLSWSADVRQSFNDEVRLHLGRLTDVPLSQETQLTMAQVVGRS